MNTDQLTSLIRGIFKAAGSALIAHGATKAASIVNAEDTVGLAVMIVGFVMSHFVHKDNSQKSPVPSADTIAKLPLFIVAAAVLALAGCAAVSPGADPFMVRVEQGQVMGDATVSFVLDIDQSDRGYWRTNAPAFHNFCEYLRAKIPNPSPGDTNHTSPRVLLIEENVHQLKETYKFSKTSANSNALYIAFGELNTLVSQAASWSNIVTTPTH